MRTHVKVLGVLFLVYGLWMLLLALAAGFGLSLLGAFIGSSGDPEAEVGAAVLGLLGVAATVAFAGLGIVAALTGLGVLTFKPWGRILGIIASALCLIRIPFGTVLGIYGLWVLFNKETEALFAGGGAPPAQS